MIVPVSMFFTKIMFWYFFGMFWIISVNNTIKSEDTIIVHGGTTNRSMSDYCLSGCYAA